MDDPTHFTSDALSVVRHNPWVMALASLPFLGTPAAILAGVPFLAVGPLLVGAFVLALAYNKSPWPVVEPTTVDADASGVRIGGLHVPRGEITGAFVLPSRGEITGGFVLPGGEPTRILLRRRRGKLPILLQGGTNGEARDMLRTLGLGVSQTVSTFRAYTRVRKRSGDVDRVRGVVAGWNILFFAIFLAVSFQGYGLAAKLVLALWMMTPLVVFFRVRARLHVGADGIVLTWLGRKRFLAYGEIEDVQRSRREGVCVKLKGAEEVIVHVGGDAAAIIQERIREAMEAQRRGQAAADAPLLRRGKRGAAEWIAALRAIGTGANLDMRTAPMPRERLFRIVEDPTASPADRAAAAITIGANLDAAGRSRLSAAAEATVAPRLRVVLEEAAKGEDDAALTEALAQVEAGEDARARTA